MQGLPAGVRPYRHTAIAFLLCLLAFSCAMEAKIAWYEPSAGPTIDARSTKAMPADTRDSSTEESAQSDAARAAGISCFLLAILATAWRLTAELTPEHRFSPPVRPLRSASYFSPQISFRPPPVL